MPTGKITLPDDMSYLDNFTEAEEIRLIKTAIEQAVDTLTAGHIDRHQDAAIYTIKALCSYLDNVADIVEDIGRRDGND